MKIQTRIIFLAMTLPIAAACSGGNPPPTNASVVDIPPPADTTQIAAPPPSTDSATPPAAPAAIAPIDPAAACLFCRIEANKCVRPDVPAAMLGSLTCGNGSQVTRSKITGAAIDCAAACCRSASEKGPDKDADGVLDANDKCPDQPEDADGFQDQDGCPDGDNDQDSVEDVHDDCCYVAEDLDRHKDLDGCPE